MNQVNRQMLTLARESRRLTQGELAERAQISQGMVSKAENGLRALSDDALAAVAAVLRYPVAFFTQQDEVRGPNAGIHHRRRAKLPARDRAALEARLNVERLRVQRVLNGVHLHTETTFPSLDVDAYGSPEESARRLREHWRLPAGPVGDLTACVEAAGGVVVARPFGTPHLSGMSQSLSGEQPFFYLNADLPADHLRFTLAHEVGHVVMHELPSPGDPEREAHRFAGELLMPEEDIRPHLQQLTFQRLLALKLHWRVSVQALLMRARDLGTLSPRSYTRMQSTLSAAGRARNEPNPLPHERPTLLSRVIDLHLGEHDYSVGELSALANADEGEFAATHLPGRATLSVVREIPAQEGAGLTGPPPRARPARGREA